jgi:hypothetical protein
MLNRLTLILRPASSYHAAIQKILREEHFDHQFGSMKVDNGDTGHTEDVVLVTCVDFHDVGVVIDKLRSRVGLSYYLVDANRAVFSYHSVNRVLTPLGLLYQSNVVLQTYNRHITIGGTTYSFWESKA